jgi:cell wall-associated NlpC family hydrolase
MIRKILFLISLVLLVGCGAIKKKTTYREERKVTVAASDNENEVALEDENELEATPPPIASPSKADAIINTALSFSGVRYKFGGTTKKGMDCSGLLYVSFRENEVLLPRISYEMAEEGKRIRLRNISKGDLLFFKTSKGRKRINHVGLVVAVDGDDIKFIHASSSRGVIVSSLREGFWNYAFVMATRVL